LNVICSNLPDTSAMSRNAGHECRFAGNTGAEISVRQLVIE
jgi:hypothetical protein